MKVLRSYTRLKRMDEEEDCYVDASPGERISIIWEITSENWSLKDRKNVERRLQRNITTLIKKQG